MCCRYWMEESPELRPIVEEMNRSPLVRLTDPPKMVYCSTQKIISQAQNY